MSPQPNVDELTARFPLAAPPEFVQHGQFQRLHYEDASLVDAVVAHWVGVSERIPPEPHPPVDPDDAGSSLTFFTSCDDEGRLHSFDDEPAHYLFAPNSEFLVAYYYSHGSLMRQQDRPDIVMLDLGRSPVINSLGWSVEKRPNDAPRSVVNNGRSGQRLSWPPGRVDGPISIGRDGIFWSLTVDQRRPTYAETPATDLLDIAYAAAAPLRDDDARLLMESMQFLSSDAREVGLLARVLARWQPNLSDAARSWLSRQA